VIFTELARHLIEAAQRKTRLLPAYATNPLDAVPPNLRDTMLYTLTGVSSLLVPTDGSTLLGLVRPISRKSVIRQVPSCQTVAASAGTPDTPAPSTPMRSDSATQAYAGPRNVWCGGTS
jgi:hypothetical protein